MQKIVSLFQRNYETDGLARNEVTPGAEWVLEGNGIATRKFDGTCCMVRDGKLYRRYDAKGGKTPPAGFEPAQEPDPITGHCPGWLLVGNGPEDKWFNEAFNNSSQLPSANWTANWTYELLGPKVNRNPEKFDKHVLVAHGSEILEGIPTDFEAIKRYLSENDIEGIVWWENLVDVGCRKVKIKGKDFGFKRGVR